MSRDPAQGKPQRLMDAAGGAVRPWHPPAMDAAHGAAHALAAEKVRVEEVLTPAPALPTAEEIEAIQREAWEEGYRAGHAEGLAAGQAEVQALAERWQALLDGLAEPLSRQEGELEAALVELALALARQLLRQELKTHPKAILPIVREALSALPPRAGEAVVRLHPEDAALVRASLLPSNPSWRIEEDETMTRGGCLVLTLQSRVDATLERRIERLMEEGLGQGGDPLAGTEGGP